MIPIPTSIVWIRRPLNSLAGERFQPLQRTAGLDLLCGFWFARAIGRNSIRPIARDDFSVDIPSNSLVIAWLHLCAVEAIE